MGRCLSCGWVHGHIYYFFLQTIYTITGEDALACSLQQKCREEEEGSPHWDKLPPRTTLVVDISASRYEEHVRVAEGWDYRPVVLEISTLIVIMFGFHTFRQFWVSRGGYHHARRNWRADWSWGWHLTDAHPREHRGTYAVLPPFSWTDSWADASSSRIYHPWSG